MKKGKKVKYGQANLNFLTFISLLLKSLLTETQSLDDSTITLDVTIVEVIEQCTTLTYELCQ